MTRQPNAIWLCAHGREDRLIEVSSDRNPSALSYARSRLAMALPCSLGLSDTERHRVPNPAPRETPMVGSSLILHIPHASRVIPPEVRANLLTDDTTLAAELLRMTDAWTDELVEGFGLAATRIAAPVSRLVVDVERFPEDADEPMAALGMGVVYERLSSGEPLRVRDPMERARLLERWYRPHHARLTDAVDAALAAHGCCLIIDVHSFASVPLPHEPDQEPNRPEICLGTDAYHSPFQDAATALAACEDHGFSANLNRPFAGSIVPMRHWGKTREVRSMMIEVRRDLYMDEATGKKLRTFEDVAAKVCRLLEAIVTLTQSFCSFEVSRF